MTNNYYSLSIYFIIMSLIFSFYFVFPAPFQVLPLNSGIRHYSPLQQEKKNGLLEPNNNEMM